jgi:hypothetical protein
LNRLCVGIFGYFRDAGEVYFPSISEWVVCVGVYAAAGLAFLFVVEHFSVFDESWKRRTAGPEPATTSIDRTIPWWKTGVPGAFDRVSLISVVALPLGWSLLYPPFLERLGAEEEAVRPVTGLDAERKVLRIDGNRAGLFTDFPHQEHRERLGGDASCAVCHHLSMPGDHGTSCMQCHRGMERTTPIFDHSSHFELVARRESRAGIQPGNLSCGSCHPEDQPKSGEHVATCLSCHDSDDGPEGRMVPAHPAGLTLLHETAPGGLSDAPGYREAMHKACIPCHRKEGASRRGSSLGQCVQCHETLRRTTRRD